jgi:hypothetical protein
LQGQLVGFVDLLFGVGGAEVAECVVQTQMSDYIAATFGCYWVRLDIGFYFDL